MRRMIQSTMKCVAIALCVLLAACTTDVYEPKPDPVPPTPEKPDPSLPNDFNQSTATIRQMTLTVEVNDEFNGVFWRKSFSAKHFTNIFNIAICHFVPPFFFFY